MIALNVTVPVLNEADCLTRNIRILAAYLQQAEIKSYEIVIADNGSTDSTLALARALASELDCVRVIHLDRPGRGAALKAAWTSSTAQVLSYMDADLSSDLTRFTDLISPISNQKADLTIGSRLLNSSTTQRRMIREVTSRVYAYVVRTVFRTRFSDPQCGFKALTQATALRLLPLIQSKSWFFDTELLVLAEQMGCRILDVPVPWIERRDSRVHIFTTIFDNLRHIIRLRRFVTTLSSQSPKATS